MRPCVSNIPEPESKPASVEELREALSHADENKAIWDFLARNYPVIEGKLDAYLNEYVIEAEYGR